MRSLSALVYICGVTHVCEQLKRDGQLNLLNALTQTYSKLRGVNIRCKGFNDNICKRFASDTSLNCMIAKTVPAIGCRLQQRVSAKIERPCINTITRPSAAGRRQCQLANKRRRRR